ncbi:DUF4391 domain-containing protein [Selenomonas sp. oral taxon 478]|uniref:DUF4391 domain-containing protein n=1 Tax=Selenomonas sp. oral taxon 478 TaxID=712538 RepID=UPI00067A20D2|nr:DUF4391 domain-containing protein [Selenomonas sp. oral taxon 478]AKT53671.1 hypothetical protein ADJ74_03970 [Selenomonas sp. oral taxon 478]
MLGLPSTTELHRRIPKQTIYDKCKPSPVLKKAFSAQIASIHWRNKIAPEILNLAAGKEVRELEVFELRLNDGQMDEAVLRLIDRAIPYHILFVLVWEDRMRLALAYKETLDAKSAGVRVKRYYYTDWMAVGEVTLRLEGLSMDAVFENLVRRIAGGALGDAHTSTLRESVAAQGRRERIGKQIAALEAKIRREKQPKKKFELVQQLRVLQTLM